MADDDERPVNFTLGAARRIKRVVDRVDGKAEAPGGRRPFGPARVPGVLPAVVTTPIPTGTTAEPSSMGMVRILWTGVEDEDDDPVPVKNRFTFPAPVPVDAAAAVYWHRGEWWLLQADCPTP